MMSICLFFSVTFFGENKLTGIFLIRFLIPRWSSGHPPLFAVSTVLHVIISKQDIQICQIFHIYSTTTLSSVLKPKYSLSIRNKCSYLLESSKTSITIWRQEYPQNCYIQGVLWRKRHGEIFYETLVDNIFRHNYSMMEIKKKLNDGKILG